VGSPRRCRRAKRQKPIKKGKELGSKGTGNRKFEPLCPPPPTPTPKNTPSSTLDH